jgi:plasmid maintenance system antidote protein VapI
MNLRADIQRAMARQHLSFTGCARRLEITPKYLSDILSGRLPVSAFVAVRLERVLGLDADAIMHGQVAEELERVRAELRAEDGDVATRGVDTWRRVEVPLR